MRKLMDVRSKPCRAKSIRTPQGSSSDPFITLHPPDAQHATYLPEHVGRSATDWPGRMESFMQHHHSKAVLPTECGCLTSNPLKNPRICNLFGRVRPPCCRPTQPCCTSTQKSGTSGGPTSCDGYRSHTITLDSRPLVLSSAKTSMQAS